MCSEIHIMYIYSSIFSSHISRSNALFVDHDFLLRVSLNRLVSSCIYISLWAKKITSAEHIVFSSFLRWYQILIIQKVQILIINVTIWIHKIHIFLNIQIIPDSCFFWSTWMGSIIHYGANQWYIISQSKNKLSSVNWTVVWNE